MTKTIKYFSLILVLLLLFIVGDYFALFGVTNKKVLDFSVLHIKTVDKDTGAPIFSAHITCYRHGNHDICQERENKKKNVVSAYFPFHKTQKNTFLFTKSEEIPKVADPDFKIMIIHNDYYKEIEDFNMNDIYASSGKEITINMESVNNE